MAEAEVKPYPKGAVFFLVTYELCERFAFYGIRAILSLYITEALNYTEREGTLIYHLFAMFIFAFPVIGAIVADSLLGKFRTIFYISIIYTIGAVVFALSTIDQLNLPQREFALICLGLIAFGTGGVKPCVAAFGGDQFELPQQQKHFDSFFLLFYFCINIGSFLSMFITPLLRKNVHCFGKQSCYPLAFAIPAILLVAAVVFVACGKPFYRLLPPAGNMLLKVSGCIGTAISVKCKSRGVKKAHWLDYAVEKHGEQLVNDIKIVLGVFFLYIPLPIFWALFEQQPTAWTFQARRMNGDIGDLFTILPDQMQVTNAVLVLLFIPLFNYVIYPVFGKFGMLTTSLQRIAAGGFLTGAAFIITAFLALGLEATYPVLPAKGNGQIRFYNILPCDISVTSAGLNDGNPLKIPSLDFGAVINIPVTGEAKFSYSMTGSCSSSSGDVKVYEKQAAAYVFKGKDATYLEDDVEKLISGDPNVRTIVNPGGVSTPIPIKFFDKSGKLVKEITSDDTDFSPFIATTYEIQIGNTFKVKTKFGLGGVYTLGIIGKSADNFDVKAIEVTKSNSIHMLWLVPQYAVITFGEIMLSISGLEFSYTEAPISMKSVLQAGWLLTNAFGQLLVVIIEALGVFERQSSMFFLYGVLMCADMFLFSIMAMRYKSAASQNK